MDDMRARASHIIILSVSESNSKYAFVPRDNRTRFGDAAADVTADDSRARA